MDLPKILIGSCVNKKPDILNEFLISLNEMNTDGLDVSYCFIDDNEMIDSKIILKKFLKNVEQGEILSINVESENQELKKEKRNWSIERINKVAYFKNNIINYFIRGNYTHLFLVDSDLVLHPYTLKSLLESKKDIISNIFWTKWNNEALPLPQVWQKDFYTLYNHHMLREITDFDKMKETMEFLNKLRTPGIYKVGGLGACTLIERGVLESGVNFDSLYNISFWGEDRSFCIRAVAHNYELFVNTKYPSYHIYNDSDIKGVEKYKQNYFNSM